MHLLARLLHRRLRWGVELREATMEASQHCLQMGQLADHLALGSAAKVFSGALATQLAKGIDKQAWVLHHALTLLVLGSLVAVKPGL
jgi:hypothetical protein